MGELRARADLSSFLVYCTLVGGAQMDLLNMREKIVKPIKDFEDENQGFMKGVYARERGGRGLRS